jgi:hypothetical protein
MNEAERLLGEISLALTGIAIALLLEKTATHPSIPGMSPPCPCSMCHVLRKLLKSIPE